MSELVNQHDQSGFILILLSNLNKIGIYTLRLSDASASVN